MPISRSSPQREDRPHHSQSISTGVAQGKRPAGEFKLKEPVPTRALSTREQIIILEASKLHGCRFPPWKTIPKAEEFALGEDQSLFVCVAFLTTVMTTITEYYLPFSLTADRDDDADFHLSETQLAVCDGWRRPDEVFSKLGERQPEVPAATGPVMYSSQRVDLVQDVTSDCSVVASLCAGTARAEKGHSKVRRNVS